MVRPTWWRIHVEREAAVSDAGILLDGGYLEPYLVSHADMLFFLTQRTLSPGHAKRLWEGILEHKEHLWSKPGRNVGVAIAAQDYLINISDVLSAASVAPSL